MKTFLRPAAVMIFVSAFVSLGAQCVIDTANTRTGFSPANPAVIRQGVSYSQTVQVYIPTSYSGVTLDSLHLDSIGGVPTGLTYIFNPASGTVAAGADGAICFSGVTTDSVGPYPLYFYGNIYTPSGPIPFSAVESQFSYKFRIEAAPTAAFYVDSPVCTSGDSVRFTDISGGYPTSWYWTFTGGSPSTSRLQYPAVSYDSAGTYSVQLIAKNSISADTIIQTIYVNPSVSITVNTSPAVGDSLSANGMAVATGYAGTPPYSYLWSNNSTGDTLSGVVTGLYWVSVTDAKGCSLVDDNVVVSFISNVLTLAPDVQVKIYPNPAGSILNINWSKPQSTLVTVVDLSGKVLSKLATTGSTNTLYNIQNLAPGNYILRFTDLTNGQQQSTLFTKF